MYDVPLDKLVNIATDGAPAMLGKKIGLIVVLRDENGNNLLEITYSDLDDDEWLQDLMFLTDAMEHSQTLNLQLQGKDKISDLSQCIFSFQTKLQLFQKDIKNKISCHFPRIKKSCSNIKQEKLNEYMKKLEEILTEFQNRFQDLNYFKLSLDFLKSI